MRGRQNIWFIMGGAMLIITLVIIIIQGCVLSAFITKIRPGDVLTLILKPTTVVAKPTLTPTLWPTFTPTLGSQPSTLTPTPAEAVLTPTSTPPSTFTPTPLPTFTPTLGSQPPLTPTPTEAIPIPTSTPPSTFTPTPLPTFTPTPTPLPTVTPMPTESPTPSPADEAWQQVAPFDQKMQEFDALVPQAAPEKLEKAECPYVGQASGECWLYRIDTGNMILVEGYGYALLPKADVYVYDLYDGEQPEIWKWDLGRDEQFDVIEYDVDQDEMLEYATADMNSNGQFDYDEIYRYQHATGSWEPLVPGAPLPLPSLPVFPY